MALRIDDIPFRLRAGDVVNHVINVDSRFRENPSITPSSNFHFRLLTPIRNVLRLRITSVELPNNYYIFSKIRRNVTLQFKFPTLPDPVTIQIPDGNYSGSDMDTTIQNIFNANTVFSGAGFNIDFDAIRGKYTFKANVPFTLDTTCNEFPSTTPGISNKYPFTFDRPFDYGLGYNLGFTKKEFPGVADASGIVHTVVSNQMCYFAGDNYVLLKINNYDCVRQTLYNCELSALAKVVLRDPKDYMSFEDKSTGNSREVTFPAPCDLARFNIQVYDPYGEIIDLDSSNFSFSLEVLEVRNLKLYNTIRDAFAADWIL